MTLIKTDRLVVRQGDCLEIMRKRLSDNSVDAIVTDPPYGLGFMGKAWDALPPGLPWAQECLRVLKPGGHILAFGGTRTWHRLAVAIEDAGFEMRDSIAWMHGQGFPKGKAQLKPAFEPIVMARKKGPIGLNIDACRIGYASEADMDQARVPQPQFGVKATDAGSYNFKAGEGRNGEQFDPSKGRWPANVVLDEAMAEVLDEQTGTLTSGSLVGSKRNTVGGNGVTHGAMTGVVGESYADSGGASRFFYVAKAPAKERPKVDGKGHATVKPLTLMRWLCKLVTPPDGLILDPFLGSGTTAQAALAEGFRCYGIERDEEYFALIRQRLGLNEPAID